MYSNKLFLLLLTILCLQAFKPEKTSRILWSESRKLNWSDFQGKQEKKIIDAFHLPKDSVIITDQDTTRIHVESEAYCYHEIQFNSKALGNALTYEVRTYFIPAHSWTKTSSEYVLDHEQRHFDLAEVSARKFRKYLSDSVSTSNQKELQRVFNMFHADDKAMQEAYDSITQHSINHEEQFRYDAQIDSMLNAYAEFAPVQIKKTMLHK